MIANTEVSKKSNNEMGNIDLISTSVDGQDYFKITNVNEMRPFFMSIVSDSNHWLFISSNGGVTAGRKNSEFALFPYYTDDKITESSEITGSKSIFKVSIDGNVHIWEPFSIRFDGKFNATRNLYKSVYGNAIIFEETNHDLKLTFRYKWSSSNIYGFVKTSQLINHSDSDVKVDILDGIQNIIPYGVGSDLQNQSSNLVDAYKRNELIKESGLGIFALSAIIVDKAEPSEALRANVAWSLGLDNPKHLLSSLQLNAFRKLQDVNQETDVKAEKGAYFVNKSITLNTKDEKEWMIVANVNYDHSDVAALSKEIREDDDLKQKIIDDITLGTKRLIKLNAASDGIQLTSDSLKDSRHFSNTLFNIMRGGIFDDNYNIEKWDFQAYLKNANKKVARTSEPIIQKLPEVFDLDTLRELAYNSDDKNFRRLCLEYMPLKFSRRHGDPSRPWNKFSINTRSEIDGSKILDYEGNWRDIFQNWEALAHSYPEYIDSMIFKFLNATTFDGYNPYRVTKGGFDWETIEPDDPWSYIGYWGDHQIIYLQKFLEFIENHQPGKLDSFFLNDMFVYANVPYKIKPYKDLLKNPKDTIEFDEELDAKIHREREELGADGALLRDENRFIVKVNFIEKILATSLAKLSNFIPEGGIWMNTQRPEWNDANNALVGNGVSMVTLYYLRRFFHFFNDLFDKTTVDNVEISKELLALFNSVYHTLEKHEKVLDNRINDKERKTILDGLGEAASTYRNKIYDNAFSGRKEELKLNDLKDFAQLVLRYLDQSIEVNRRADGLYHAYNLMTVTNDNGISISYLDEMLEGQVAALSSGYLSANETLSVLDGMKKSKLFRPDQYSYLLYPNKDLKGFMERNQIPEKAVKSSELLQTLLKDKNTQIITKDVNGVYHFNGNFKNANDLKSALDAMGSSKYKKLVKGEESQILQIFEEVFNHKAFTGRSGTFYGYEGLGSIYWHMVSKLLLAVQECCLAAINNGESDVMVGKLLEHYYEINEGIGVHKSPKLYGAFPTDPYSHTPGGKGAQQPGMTGQVKEDILSRFGELGIFVKNGTLGFDPCLLRKSEFVDSPRDFNYITLSNDESSLNLKEHSLAFTYCQVPIVYRMSDQNNLKVVFNSKDEKTFMGSYLDEETSKTIFKRLDKVSHIHVEVAKDHLK